MANILVNAGGNLPAALSAAAAGDFVLLERGATFTNNFRAPLHSGSTDVTVQTNVALPPASTRMTPTLAASLGLATIRAPGAGPSCWDFALGAHHWTLRGLQFPQVPTGQGECISIGFGDSQQTTVGQVPHHITLDQLWIYGNPNNGGQKRGVGMNGATVTIKNSYIEKCVRAGQDAQAIGGWNGPGPLTITNCFLEASGENILLGGDDPRIPNLVTTDVTITGNHLYKPLSWRTDGSHWTVKNLFELKNAQTVLFDNNLVEGCWVSAQTGSAIVLTPRNQNGTAPWVIVKDVTLTNNIIRHAGNCFNILGIDDLQPSQRTTGIIIRNNLAYDIDGPGYGGGFGCFLQLTAANNIGVHTLTAEHNTAITSNRMVYFDGQSESFTFLNNIVTRGLYGIMGAGTSEGTASISAHCTISDIRKNCFVGASSSRYPSGNFFPATLADVQFVDLANHDYQLQP